MSLLGIDVGTTGCKAAAFSEDGICLASAYREYRILHPSPGLAELNSREVLSSVKACIGEVAGKSRKNPITALSVSSPGEAMTPVSKDRKILGNCILSSDIRGAEYIESLSKEIGTFECITPTYNHFPDPSLMIENGRNVEHHMLPNLFVSFLYN